jgi:hypothetical protein
VAFEQIKMGTDRLSTAAPTNSPLSKGVQMPTIANPEDRSSSDRDFLVALAAGTGGAGPRDVILLANRKIISLPPAMLLDALVVDHIVSACERDTRQSEIHAMALHSWPPGHRLALLLMLRRIGPRCQFRLAGDRHDPVDDVTAQLHALTYFTPPLPDGDPCPRCKMPAVRYTWRRFRDGRWHIDSRCRQCGNFLGWAPQTAFYIARAGGPPPSSGASATGRPAP